ncbi:unnamed protein product [Closterium sp. NIES-54]
MPVQQKSGLPTLQHSSSACGGAEPGGVEPGGVETGGAESEGARSGGDEPGGSEPRGAEPEGVEHGGAESESAESGGVASRGAASSGGPSGASLEPLSPQRLREWLVWRARLRSGAAGGGATGDSGAGGAGDIAGAGGTGGTTAAGPGGARTRGAGARGSGAGASGAGAGGTGTGGAGAGGAGAGGTGSGGAGAGGAGAVNHGAGGAGAGGARGAERSQVRILVYAHVGHCRCAQSWASHCGGVSSGLGFESRCIHMRVRLGVQVEDCSDAEEDPQSHIAPHRRVRLVVVCAVNPREAFHDQAGLLAGDRVVDVILRHELPTVLHGVDTARTLDQLPRPVGDEALDLLVHGGLRCLPLPARQCLLHRHHRDVPAMFWECLVFTSSTGTSITSLSSNRSPADSSPSSTPRTSTTSLNASSSSWSSADSFADFSFAIGSSVDFASVDFSSANSFCTALPCRRRLLHSSAEVLLVASAAGDATGASLEPLSPQQLREWLVRRARLRSGATGAGATADSGAEGARVTAGAGGTGGTAAAGPRGARTRGTGAAETGDGAGGIGAGASGAGARGTGAGGAGAGGAGAVNPRAGGAGDGGACGTGAGGTVWPRPYFVPLLQQPASPLPAPSPYTKQSGSLTERGEPASCPVSTVRTTRRVPRLRPPPVPGTHAMALRPSSVPLRVPLPAPPESSLPEVPDPDSDRARAVRPAVSRLLATAVTDPSFESAAASALVAELLDFSAACRLDYASALGTDVLEDRQEDFECLAAVASRFASVLLAPEGDLDAPDIPTPRSYAEAITGPYYFQWQAAMDAEMASWKSTGTYVNEVHWPGTG